MICICGSDAQQLMQTVTDAAIRTGLAAGYGWLSKKVIKEPMTGDPS